VTNCSADWKYVTPPGTSSAVGWLSISASSPAVRIPTSATYSYITSHLLSITSIASNSCHKASYCTTANLGQGDFKSRFEMALQLICIICQGHLTATCHDAYCGDDAVMMILPHEALALLRT